MNRNENFSDNSNIENATKNNEYFGDSFYSESKNDDMKSYSSENNDLSNKNKNISIVLNNYSNIYNKSDEDSMINSLAEKIAEYVAYGGEGTHI